jgi:uncharacterized protein
MRLSLKSIFVALLILIFAGCLPSNQTSNKGAIDPNLPKPQNVRVITTHNSAAFEWDLVGGNAVEGFFVYRAGKDGTMEKIASLKDRFATHYEDSGLKSDTSYQYRFSSYSSDGAESDGSGIVSAKTQQPIDAVSFIANVDNLPNRAKIVWRPHTNPSVVSYIIQKTDVHKQKWEDIATIKGRLQAEYIDKDVESGKIYFYRVVAKSYDDGLSYPSQSVEVKVKKLPIPINAAYATKDIPKQIVVTWDAPEQKEFANFRVYRAEKTDGSYKIVIDTQEKKLVDKIDEDGAVRYYKVTTIDKDGLESIALNVATGLTKALPSTPRFTFAGIRENKIVLTWTIDEKSELTYRVTKKWGNLLNRSQLTFSDIKGFSFEDKDVQLGLTYSYYIESIDKDGLASKPSQEVELFVPKGL